MEPAQNVLTRSQQHNVWRTRYVQLVHNWARFMPAQRSFFFKIAVLVCQIAPSCDSATYISQTVLLNWERGGPRAGKSESFPDTAAPPNNTQCYLVYTVVWCLRYPVLKLPEIFRICCVCHFNLHQYSHRQWYFQHQCHEWLSVGGGDVERGGGGGQRSKSYQVASTNGPSS